MNYHFTLYTGKEKPPIQFISNYIVPQWAPWWRQLGTELKIDDYLMRIIERDNPNNCQRCCFELLEEWMNRNPEAFLEDLIVATNKLSLHGMTTV